MFLRLRLPDAHALCTAVAGLLAATTPLAGCDEGIACTEIACVDQLTVVVRPPVLGFAAGAYQVEVATTAGTQRCGLTIERGCADVADCVVDDEWRLLTTADDGSAELRYYSTGAPASATITVLRNGIPLTQVTRSPTYQTVAPNGEQCGPVCEQSEETVQLP